MKILCKIADDEICPKGLHICCGTCAEQCEDRCPMIDNGEPFSTCPNAEQVTDELVTFQSAVPEAIRIITEINVKKKELDAQEKLMREEILKAMETYGVKKFENEQVSFTYVAPTTKTSIDSTKLKKKYPEIAEECSKVSNVSASVRIVVK